ncbi:TonB-dependent receptor [Herbaspirillum sp. meg3]|uniref:TonB-dependent hemoglobin/transferrin/lactoferrin family receptor n=1 Tax=Herbaspirillum sp. meg3 TaxID=2025949 RepID=UPI000B981BEA|nr:TonB-dependent hemoglobin/transferrin/lactoferrin family receptor [Herbaspirillum sp. meg3]ASU40869.1 TonB-dependent receptor [Herbaspirillum sp. meg3]
MALCKKKLALATAVVLQQWSMAPVMAQQVQQSTPQLLAQSRPLEDITVTSTRGIGTDINRVAATVSVITSEELEQENAKDIKDALRYEPGVEVRRSVYRVGGVTGASATMGRGGNEGISIRGLDGNRVMLLEDGVALPRSFSQGTLFAGRGAYTDTDLYQRIEILRGPASSMYGSDGLTGVVNFVTKDPQDLLNVFGKNSYFAVRPSYDSSDSSYGTTGTMAFGNDVVQGMLVLNARHGNETETNGSVGGTGATRTKADPLTYNNRSALGKVVFKIDPRNVVKLSFETVDNRLRGDSLSAITSVISGYQSNSNVKSNKLQAIFEHDDADNALIQKLRANVYYRDSKTQQYSYESGTTVGATVRPRFRDITYQDDIFGGGVLAESAFNTGVVKHKMTYGVDASTATIKMNASGTGWTTCTGTQYCEYFPKTSYSVLGLYYQDDMRIGPVSIVPGLRYDAYKLKPEASAKYDAQAIANGQPASTSKDSAWSPRLAFVYEVAPAFAPYVQYARGFRAPSPQEVNSYFNNASQGYSQIANPNLKPETSNSYEIGFRGKLPTSAGLFNYSAAAYTGEYRNFIDSVTISGGGTVLNPTIYQYVNAAKASINGFEGRLDWRMENGLSLKTGFAYTKGTTTSNTGVKTGLESVAPLSVVTGVRYEPNQVWFVQSDMIYNAAKKKDDIATKTNFVSPSFFVVDLRSGYRFNKNLSFNAGIRNLFDRKYWSWTDIRGLSLADSATNKDAYTEPGRSFNVSMKYEY